VLRFGAREFAVTTLCVRCEFVLARPSPLWFGRIRKTSTKIFCGVQLFLQETSPLEGSLQQFHGVRGVT
jgi:hypothetical protein